MSKEEFYNEVGWVKNPDVARDIAAIENRGHLPLPESRLEELRRRLPWKRSKEQTDIEAAQDSAEAYEKMRKKQFEVGEKLFEEIEEAAQENHVYNLLDGNPVEDVGPMRVGKMEANGPDYSINVELDSQKTMQGAYPLYQINVNLGNEGNEIHVFQGPYGPDKFYAIQSLELLTEKLKKEISEYRLYRESES